MITVKNSRHTARAEVITRLAIETAAALKQAPDLRLVLGHGSGSFGHVPALRHGTRQGVDTPEGWAGFVEVWQEAAALNRLVVDAFQAQGLPALPFPPSAAVVADDGLAASWEVEPIQAALRAGLLPVVYGDVVFDRRRGGTILSTEDLFEYLALRLKPHRVLLAGLDPGVCADYPACLDVFPEITPERYAQIASAVGGSAVTDVTGGMRAKVEVSLRLASSVPGLDVYIFSGDIPGAVQQALLGTPVGTRIYSTSHQFI